MKRLLISVLIPLAACGGEEAPAAAPSAPAPAAAAPAATAPSALGAASQTLARLGGTVLAAGQKLVEVLPFANGTIQASLMDGQGTLVADPAATLTVKVQGADGAQHPVALSWDADAQVYTGSVGAEVTVAPGPVEVVVASGGAAATARAERVSVAPVATHEGQVMIAGDRGAEVRVGADGKVEAWVAGEDGAFLETAEDGSTFTVNVGAEGEGQPVSLAWDAQAGHYVGRAQGVQLGATTPVRLSVARGQALGLTRVAEVRVRQGARQAGSVQVGVRADGKPPEVQIGNADVRVRLPGAAVNVRGGNVDVRAPGVAVSAMGGSTTQQAGAVRVQVGGAPGRGTTVRAPGVSVSAMGGVRAPGVSVSAMGGVRAPGVSVSGMGGVQAPGVNVHF